MTEIDQATKNFLAWDKIGIFPVAKIKVVSTEQVKQYYDLGRHLNKDGSSKSDDAINKELQDTYIKGDKFEIEYVDKEEYYRLYGPMIDKLNVPRET